MTYTSIATDSFTRANAALGANWTNLMPGATSTPQVFSNKAAGSQSASGDFFPTSVWSGSGTFTNDHYAQVVTGTMSTQDDTYRMGVILRASTATDASRQYYQCTVSSMGPGLSTNTVRITKFNGDTRTELANVTNILWTTGDVLFASAVGTTITVYKGVGGLTQLLQTTDASYSTGKPGLVASGGLSSGIVTVDDWEGGSVTAASGFFRNSPGGSLSGLGSGGKFFQNPLQ